MPVLLIVTVVEIEEMLLKFEDDELKLSLTFKVDDVSY